MYSSLLLFKVGKILSKIKLLPITSQYAFSTTFGKNTTSEVNWHPWQQRLRRGQNQSRHCIVHFTTCLTDKAGNGSVIVREFAIVFSFALFSRLEVKINKFSRTFASADGRAVFKRNQGCQMAKFDPFLSLDCARVEGVGAQSKERKGSNFAA